MLGLTAGSCPEVAPALAEMAVRVPNDPLVALPRFEMSTPLSLPVASELSQNA
jgi:hypothetical protein